MTVAPGFTVSRTSLLAALLLAGLLTGCASLDTAPARESVRQTVAGKTGQAVPPRVSGPAATEPVELPDADAAARLALSRNPAMEALLAELDMAEAAAVQATLLRNPFLHASVLYPRDGHGGKALDVGVSWDLPGLLSLGPRQQAADQARAAARFKAVAGLLELAARSRAAWYAHLADREGEAWWDDQLEAAALQAEIARRLEQAGNLPPLAAAGARAAHLEAESARGDARRQARASLEQLAGLLGVGVPGQLRLPEQLPRLPVADPPAPDPAILEEADWVLAALRADLERARQVSEVARQTGWTDTLELGWAWGRESDGAWKDGPALGLSLPLFDTGAARRAAARFETDRLAARIAERRLTLAREAREAVERMQRARVRVENLRENLLPLLSEAQDAALLQYNAMQKSPFHLLDLKQREIAAVRQLIQGLADYWQARTALEALGQGVSLGSAAEPRALAPALPASSSGGH